MTVNKVILLGNIWGDPEVRTAGSTTVANVSLATTRKFKDAQGQVQKETEWHRVVFFGRLAEIARDYLKKGRPIYVEGRLKRSKYVDKQGVERWVTDVIGESMQMLGSKNDNQGQQYSQAAPATAPAPQASQAYGYEDDCPF